DLVLGASGEISADGGAGGAGGAGGNALNDVNNRAAGGGGGGGGGGAGGVLRVVAFGEDSDVPTARVHADGGAGGSGGAAGGAHGGGGGTPRSGGAGGNGRTGERGMAILIGLDEPSYDAGLLVPETHDPSFESASPKWTFTATDSTYGSQTDPALDGSKTFRSTSCTTAFTGRTLQTTSFVAGIQATDEYTLQVGAYHSGAQWADTEFELNLQWYNASDGLISTSSSGTLNFAAQSQWALRTLVATAPSGAVKAKVLIRWRRTTGTTSGRQLSFDRIALLET
ncbi:MAG: hypothetical protein M9894_17555, partial [Planctomycetes bacterium]|nr:hypothetical protein [Planctomycetota bacterium]